MSEEPAMAKENTPAVVKGASAEDVTVPREPTVVVNSTAVPSTTASNQGLSKRWKCCAAIAAIVVFIIILVVIVSSSREGEYVPYVPLGVNFATGVSLITSYDIKATIGQRLAKTIITMEVANALDCTSIHGITLQLPLNARVASLETVADDGCTTTGQVEKLEDARESFVETASNGLPGAYVEARDSTTYSLQVSLPAMGNTVVVVEIEEILHQKVGKVEFQLPLVPYEKVDQVSLGIEILGVDSVDLGLPVAEGNGTDVQSGPRFELDMGPDLDIGVVSSPYTMSLSDAREYDLPQVVRGEFSPGKLPDTGVLVYDGNCFEHVFLPSTLGSKAKNVFFLVDASSLTFFSETKTALKQAINDLSPQDTLTIQAFTHQGTSALWGSTKATEAEKVEAMKFVDELVTQYGSNLHEALLECLLRAKRDADDDPGTVSLLVLLSNSWASTGATNRTKIVSDVWKLNEEGKVKIFSLASPRADTELLQAIAITNGGKTSRIAEGTVDFSSQMKSFFDSEFGTILLSDVAIEFGTDAGVYGATRSSFPVLAQGSEVIVRGLLPDSTNGDVLKAVTTAKTSTGERSWTAEAQADPFVTTAGLPNSRCFQSYAHARVSQLMHFRDVAVLLGDGVVEPIVTLQQPCDKEKHSFAECIEAEALQLALDAKLVIPSLTAIATVDNDKCLPYEEEAEICLDGTAKSNVWEDGTYSDMSAGSSARPVSLTLLALSSLAVLVSIWF